MKIMTNAKANPNPIIIPYPNARERGGTNTTVPAMASFWGKQSCASGVRLSVQLGANASTIEIHPPCYICQVHLFISIIINRSAPSSTSELADSIDSLTASGVSTPHMAYILQGHHDMR